MLPPCCDVEPLTWLYPCRLLQFSKHRTRKMRSTSSFAGMRLRCTKVNARYVQRAISYSSPPASSINLKIQARTLPCGESSTDPAAARTRQVTNRSVRLTRYGADSMLYTTTQPCFWFHCLLLSSIGRFYDGKESCTLGQA